jgi:hypothetical protein
MSNLMLNRQNNKYHPLDHIFKPQRSLIKVFDNINQSIEKTVTHYIAGLYEHRMALPSLMNENTFKDMLYHKLAKIYDKLEIDFPFPPDMLFLFELNHTNEDNFKQYKSYFKNRKTMFEY